MIGIIAAMRGEIARIIESIADPCERRVGGLDMVVGEIVGRPVVAASCGLGKVKAAAATQAMIDAFAPEAILCIGTAGAIAGDIKIGDIVVAEKAYQHDFDISGGSKIVSLVVGGKNKTLVSCDEKLVALAMECGAQMEPRVRVVAGLVVTGDRAIMKRGEKKEIAKKTGALCVEMEGAAVGAICARNGVAFAILRGITDTAESRVPLEFVLHAKKVFPVVQALTLRIIGGFKK